MGICSSCLGRRNAASADDTDSRLLFEDRHSINYGSFGDHNPATLQSDPQDFQRETEALQKIVAQTSNHLVDIFALVPQNTQRSPSTFSGRDARLLQYQDVLANLSSSDRTEPGVASATSQNSAPALDWPSDDDDDEDEEMLKDYKVNEPERTGPLLGGFAEIGTNFG